MTDNKPDTDEKDESDYERLMDLDEARIELYKKLVEAEVISYYTRDEEIKNRCIELQDKLKEIIDDDK